MKADKLLWGNNLMFTYKGVKIHDGMFVKIEHSAADLNGWGDPEPDVPFPRLRVVFDGSIVSRFDLEHVTRLRIKKDSAVIKFLLWVGFVSRRNDHTRAIVWPFSVPSRDMFRFYLKHGPRFYVFRNLPGVIKWRKGRLLPRRWGFGFCGFEFGDRGH